MNTYRPEGALISSAVNYEYLSSAEGLERAAERGIILEGMVTLCDHELNLRVDLPSGVAGIIPKSEALLSKEGNHAKDIAILTRVGKPVCFKIIGFDTDSYGRKRAILSRRAAQKECLDYYVSTLCPGDIIPARITHLENFGAFVDIGCGIISLLSIDCISVSRISHPSERLSVGDRINVIVKSIDEKGRIFVSLRELLGTWCENASLFSEGETVSGTVRGVESYGIFVELSPNLAGLAEYRDNVFSGQTAAVYIKSIIPEKMKIKLIIIDAQYTNTGTEPLKYFIDTESVTHLDRWIYSPKTAERVVESVFLANDYT
ncbi:MAG: 30S ribosomal protein S1 [Clostridia bacterium]|nr:30S ribosomal protein S1 [Clostridia bacterium]